MIGTIILLRTFIYVSYLLKRVWLSIYTIYHNADSSFLRIVRSKKRTILIFYKKQLRMADRQKNLRLLVPVLAGTELLLLQELLAELQLQAADRE